MPDRDRRVFEWRKSDKQPFAIGFKDRLTVMGGLYETWNSPAGERIPTCTIITVPANPFMEALHDRMPVILNESDWPAWLGEAPGDPETLRNLVAPYAGDDLGAYPVDNKVGSVKNNDASLATPIDLAELASMV
jgi:putative SOS response-associated peptidase YedK